MADSHARSCSETPFLWNPGVNLKHELTNSWNQEASHNILLKTEICLLVGCWMLVQDRHAVNLVLTMSVNFNLIRKSSVTKKQNKTKKHSFTYLFIYFCIRHGTSYDLKWKARISDYIFCTNLTARGVTEEFYLYTCSVLLPIICLAFLYLGHLRC